MEITVRTLADLCETIYLGRPPARRSDSADGKSHTAIGLRALDASGYIDFNDLDSLKEKDIPDPIQAVKAGDVLLAIRGSLAKAAIVTEPTSFPTFVTSNIALLRPNPVVLNPYYLWLWLQSRIQRGVPEFKRSTTGQQSISVIDLRKMRMSVLPMARQAHIQRVVETMLKYRQNQREQATKMEEFFGSFLKEIFPQ